MKGGTEQRRAPIADALLAFRDARVVPFDVPGHKRGRGSAELSAFLGERCLSVDVNSMKPLDNLGHPVSVIREAEELAAAAFSAKQAFFMVNGTSSAVQAMIMSVCRRGDKLILPRNVHKSVINAMVLCGAVPIYVNPHIDASLGIPLGMSPDEIKAAADRHPDAKAIFVNNPTYYGVCSDLSAIVSIARQRGMMTLVDEAHGAHFYFGRGLPKSAMAAGADMASVSMHKSGGSLTQSSFLLTGNNVNYDYVRQIINLTQTTSASYLLLSSLDIARRKLALEGEEIFRVVLENARYARDEINSIGDYRAFGRELINGDTVFDFDMTKLSVNTFETGLAGIEVYDMLRDDYDIQIEFGDLSNFLAYLSVGDRRRDLERLVSALSEIRRLNKKSPSGMLRYEYTPPKVSLIPQEAFYANKEQVPIERARGRICAEFVMCYPPGIPMLAPGEEITGELVEHIVYAKERGCFMTGTEDPEVSAINVVL